MTFSCASRRPRLQPFRRASHTSACQGPLALHACVCSEQRKRCWSVCVVLVLCVVTTAHRVSAVGRWRCTACRVLFVFRIRNRQLRMRKSWRAERSATLASRQTKFVHVLIYLVSLKAPKTY